MTVNSSSSPLQGLSEHRNKPHTVIAALSNPAYRQKFFWLIVCVCTLILPIIVIPKIATRNPAIDSKDLALRFLLYPFGLAALWNYKKFARRQFSWPDIGFAALVLAHIASTLFSGRIGYCFETQWQMDALILVGWLIYRSSPGPHEGKILLYVMIFAAVIASLYGLSTYLGFDFLQKLYPFKFEQAEMGGRNYIHSFFGNPEYFGSFVAPMAVAALGLALGPGAKRSYQVGGLVACLFILLVLALSGGRSAFLGFAAGTVLLFASHFRFMRRETRKQLIALALGGTAVLGVVVVILSTPNPLNRRDVRLVHRFLQVADVRSASVRERILFYTVCASNIAENPIWGAGPGTFRLEFFNGLLRFNRESDSASVTKMSAQLNNRLAEHAHNDYLEFWCDLGTVGLAALLLLITMSWWFFLGRFRRKSVQGNAQALEIQALRAIFFSALCAVWVNAFFSFPFHMPARALQVWTLWACFFAFDESLAKMAAQASGINPSIAERANLTAEAA